MAASGPQTGQVEANEFLKQDTEKGRVPVHTFDSAAPPAEKGAIAGKARDQLKSVSDKAQPVERGLFSFHDALLYSDVVMM